MEMVVGNGVPFTFIQSKYFKNFLVLVQRCKGHYYAPSDYAVRHTLLDLVDAKTNAAVEVSVMY